MIIDLVIFVIAILLLVILTKMVVLVNIRRMAVYLKLDSHVVGKLLGYSACIPEIINVFIAARVGLFNDSIFNVITSNIIKIIFAFVVSLAFWKFKGLFRKKFIKDYILILITTIAPCILYYFGVHEEIMTISILVNIYLIFLLFNKNNRYFEDEDDEIEKIERRIKIEEKKLHLKTRKLNKERKHKVAIIMFNLIIAFVILYILSYVIFITLNNLAIEHNFRSELLGILMGIFVSIPELITFIFSYKRHNRVKNYKNDQGAIEVINNLVTSNIAGLCIVHTIAIILVYFR